MNYYNFFIHYSVLGPLGYFQGLSIINNTAITLPGQVILSNDWTSFEYKIKIGIDEFEADWPPIFRKIAKLISKLVI